MVLACQTNGIDHVGGGAVGTGVGRTAEFVQTIKAYLSVSCEPFVGGFATDGEASSQLTEGIQTTLIVADELVSFFHGFSLVSGHDTPPSRCTIPHFTHLLPMCPV